MAASHTGSGHTGLHDVPHAAHDLGAVMSRIARTLQQEHGDVPATLESITSAAVRTVPGADWASVSLVSGRKVSSQAPTDDRTTQLDALQTEAGQGPCLDALREEQTVRVTDFATEERWPAFAAAAVGLGVGSLLSFQLFTDGDNLGALNLYAGHPDAFDEEAETVGQVFASHAAIALSAARQERNLRAAIDRRDLIGQAKGILMERHRLTAVQAFAVLVEASSTTNRKLFDVADELTSTGIMPPG
ncbi:GAF and ANTAR domain-containing protein [Modestobacter versicolor]|uniref:Antitermination regulator n=1 Tax=Modestobacter versicolor TaxID=429133 RepID=A0A323V9J5_9ACTN|nr:GAF and ANTAR domain-containing protein [Modestobacter versicolor]MBB3676023.1 GAF domain-containing protein [Modestobacter versicolor]PZA21502.1 antitermination regulator [Modestobacter versicolor]